MVDGRRGKLLWNWIDSMKSERIAEAVNGAEVRDRHGSAGVGWSGWTVAAAT